MTFANPLRPRNTVMLFKIETTKGVDAAPVEADAFPFEADGYSYNAPWRSEASAENTGSMVDGAPLIVGQAAEVTIRVRLKGANTTYTSSVKPPHHALLEASGKKALFTASVAAQALAAGTISTATLGASFPATAQALRGMPLQLSGGTSGGRLVHVSDYSASKVATLTDLFGSALTVGVTAALPANWTYAGTSPKSAAARGTDHPTGTLYIYEDGVLHKFIGCRATITNLQSATARPGFATFRLMGIYGGKSDATVPTVTLAGHSAPVVAMGADALNPAILINRKALDIGNWSLADNAAMETVESVNTAYGFDTPELGGRSPVLTVDPLANLVATRDTLAEIAAGTQYPGVIRAIGAAGNRWSIVHPLLTPTDPGVGQRGQYRSEDLQLRALTAGVDAQGRDSETILCFY